MALACSTVRSRRKMALVGDVPGFGELDQQPVLAEQFFKPLPLLEPVIEEGDGKNVLPAY